MNAKQLADLIKRMDSLAKELDADPGQFIHSTEVHMAADTLFRVVKLLTEELGRKYLGEL